MNKSTEPKEDFLGMSEAKYMELVEIVHQKDYNSLALSYIDNHPRILHYLSQEPYNLLPTNAEGRRKYSLMDLLLLGIIISCREFGMEKAALFELKQYLLGTDAEIMVKEFTENKKMMEMMLQQQHRISLLQAKALADKIIKYKDQILAQKTSRLLQFTLSAIYMKEPHYFLVNKDGGCLLFTESNFENLIIGNTDFRNFYRTPHLSICLNEIISFFLSKDYIEDKLKSTIFTEDEWKIIKVIRSDHPKSITIHFSDEGNPESYDLTKTKSIKVEARLTEVIAKSGYSEMLLKTKDGKILRVEATTKKAKL